MHPQVTRSLVKAILEKPLGREWSIQGLGMLRLYLSREVRLHVWDSRFSVPKVSTLHDHPWHFKSQVIAGVVWNRRYVEGGHGQLFMEQQLQCGPGGCLKSEPRQVSLRACGVERYGAGERYAQRADEIHESEPEIGTVTIIERSFTEDAEHARVYWPVGAEWVSAEPRRATEEEVLAITSESLRRWFNPEGAKA